MSNGSGKPIEYCTVSFTVGWLPSTVGLTEAAKSLLAQERGIDKKVIRGSYAILGASKDPLIKEGAALKRLLTTVRESYTIPECAIRTTALDSTPIVDKVKGHYIIESLKVENFLKRFEDVRQQYLAWGQRLRLEENYVRLRAADQEALGDDWLIVEKKYPSADALADAISCDIPRISPFDASFTIEDVAPETARILREQAAARLEASVDSATVDLLEQFRQMISAVARNCGTRIRLCPPAILEYEPYRNAEVISITSREDDPEIPEGSILLEYRKAKQEASGKIVPVAAPEKVVITEDFYKKLQPYYTQEKKQLTTAAFDNLMDLARKIQSVGELLGPERTDILSLVAEVESKLSKMGSTAKAITQDIRSSDTARMAVKETFDSLYNQVTKLGIEVKERTNSRRRFITNLSDLSND